MKHICVIGGTGFIGQNLVRQLVDTGYKVKVIGRRSKSNLGNSITYLQNNNTPDFFLRAFENVDQVIELAYSTTPKTSFDNPTQDIFENLAFSVKIFEALLKSEVSKIVCVSSGGTVYGQSLYSPINEDHPTDPISPYGITKLAIEKYGRMYFQISGLPVIIVRPGNAYGEGQIPFLGQGFIPTAIATALKGDKVKVYGGNFGTIRDYVYVEDIVFGIIAALENGELGECYNLGTGVGRSTFEVLKMIDYCLKPVGYKIEYEILKARPFDVVSNILDSQKLTAISGWKPKTDFELGLKKTVSWLLENQELR